MMHNKILTLAIILLCWINIQTGNSQTADKWLPSSIVIENNQQRETITMRLKYDTKNRFVSFKMDFGENIAVTEYHIEYGNSQKPNNIIEIISLNDSILKQHESVINYLDNNKIEIKGENFHTNILHLDNSGKFLTKLEESTNDSIKTKSVTTTFEYKNNILHRRADSIILVTKPFKIGNEELPSETKIHSTSYTYKLESERESAFKDFDLRWLSVYLKIEDIFAMPDAVIRLEDIEDSMPKGLDVTYHYNDDGFKTGWDVIDKEKGEEVYCKIEYIKLK